MNNWGESNSSVSQTSSWGGVGPRSKENVNASWSNPNSSDVSPSPNLGPALNPSASDVSSSGKRSFETNHEESNCQKKIKNRVVDIMDPDFGSKIMDDGKEVFEKAISKTSECQMKEAQYGMFSKADMVGLASYF